MLVLKKTTTVMIPIASIVILLFTLCTDRNLRSLDISLVELQSTRDGLYKVGGRIVNIDEDSFTINDGNTSITIMGRLQDKKISDLVTQSKHPGGSQLWGEVQLKKGNGVFNMISIRRLEDSLYIEDPDKLKGKIIINTKGVIGKFQ